MMKIPARFQRMAAAFEESSGSEHSPAAAESYTDLSDLVKSFMERDYYYLDGGDRACDDVAEKEQDGAVSDGGEEWSLSEAVGTLQRLFGGRESDGIGRRKIEIEAELACRLIGEKPSSPGFKRKLMTHFRQSGIDSGMCKSKWEKLGRFPAGNYEYVDVKVDETRYIVEVCLVGEFDIARPTSQYASLLKTFPKIYVGKVEELKKIVKVMCRAMRESMKSKDIHIPPWRRNRYMEAKWFGSYKRTTNEQVPTTKNIIIRSLLDQEADDQNSNNNLAPKKSFGFQAFAFENLPLYCRGEFGRRNYELKVGHLTAAFDGQGIGM